VGTENLDSIAVGVSGFGVYADERQRQTDIGFGVDAANGMERLGALSM
jgi:hypothetical protein